MDDMSRNLGARGMFHNKLEGFRWPPMMIFSFFTISTWYLVNSATQLLSHSCPIDIREPDLRSLKMCLICASWESLVERVIVMQVEVWMLAPFATCTEGPVYVGWISVQYCLAEGNN